MIRSATGALAPLLLGLAGAAAAQEVCPGSAGLRGRLLGEAPGLPVERLAPGERGGTFTFPGDPGAFVRFAALEPGGPGEPLPVQLAALHWPAGLAPCPGTLRIFVQGLNTPRADDPQGDIGADARLAHYLRLGYLAAPTLAVHNFTALELAEVPAPAGLPGWWRGRLEALAPLRGRDGNRAALLRFTGLGANRLWTSGEIGRLRDLLLAALQARPAPRLHLIGYSDGTLLVEHALALAAERLSAERGAAAVEALLRERVFLEYWGNATPPRVPGPRRLLIHATCDPVVSRVVLGRRMGVLTAADVPARFRADTVVVSYESHYQGWNGHNALTSIGPALAAILQRELGQDPRSAPGPVAFDDAPTLRLYERLRARGERERHYAPAELDVDFTRWAGFLWKTGEATREPARPGPGD